MTEQEALAVMVPPGQKRPGKAFGGVIQVLVTSSCNLSCVHCTQASQLARKPWFMTPEQFEQAVRSLAGYFGVVGVFGGCPTISPHFEEYCRVLRDHVPFERRGLWANNLMGKGAACRATFNPAVSNLNVHLDRKAYDEFRRDWPEARPFGLAEESRHSPPYVALAALIADKGERWELISACPINRHWSAMIGVFRGELRAWFCEIAGAQAILHQDDPSYPDTGLDPAEHGRLGRQWWQAPMAFFAEQVRWHCHDCGVPMQGHGALSQDPDAAEQVSEVHHAFFRPKRKGRRVELVTLRGQLGEPLERMTNYLGNAREK
jgi:hypothetical protein